MYKMYKYYHLCFSEVILSGDGLCICRIPLFSGFNTWFTCKPTPKLLLGYTYIKTQFVSPFKSPTTYRISYSIEIAWLFLYSTKEKEPFQWFCCIPIQIQESFSTHESFNETKIEFNFCTSTLCVGNLNRFFFYSHILFLLLLRFEM